MDISNMQGWPSGPISVFQMVLLAVAWKEEKVNRWTILKLTLFAGIILLATCLQFGLIGLGHAQPDKQVVKRFKIPTSPSENANNSSSTRLIVARSKVPLYAAADTHITSSTSFQNQTKTAVKERGTEPSSLTLAEAPIAQGKEQNTGTAPEGPPDTTKPKTPIFLSPVLKEGIQQYKEENFEEAIEILEQERRRHPDSSIAAFFLGMAYKQTMDYTKALENLKASASLPPRIKEAVIELVDVLLILKDYEQAQTWLDVADNQNIDPGKIAFLKGELYSRQNRCEEAAQVFEKAQTINPSYRQAAEFKVALCYLKAQKLKAAQERLKASILLNPQSDMAEFARHYQDMIQARIERERPLQATISVNGQHNSNLLTTPKDVPYRSGEDPLDSYGLATSLRMYYTPNFKGPWLFSGQLSTTSSLNNERPTSRDSLSTSVSLVPGYNFGLYTLNLAVSYDYSLLRNPGYDDYMQAVSIGPLLRMSLGQRHVLELFAGYAKTDYIQPPTQPEEDRDVQTLSAYISWIWLFTDASLFNLRYEYIDEDADGIWWVNTGHKVSGSVTIPLIDNVSLQVSGLAYIQDFKNNHTLLNNQEPRRNETSTASAGIFWDINRKTRLLGSYTYNRAYSNIGYYDYDQEIYTVGIEYRF